MRSIWGTNINSSEVSQSFRNFLENFKEATAVDSKYMMLLSQIKTAQLPNLNVDMQDIYHHDRRLYENIVNYPQEVVPLCDVIIHSIFQDNWPEEYEQMQKRIQVWCSCVAV